MGSAPSTAMKNLNNGDRARGIGTVDGDALPMNQTPGLRKMGRADFREVPDAFEHGLQFKEISICLTLSKS